MSFGLQVLRAAKDPTDENDLAATGLDILIAGAITNGLRPRDFSSAFKTDAELTGAGAAMWAQCGFPTVEMGHKFAASLLVSTIDKDMLADLHAPWKSFLILLPDNLLFITDEGTKQPTPIRQILVFQFKPGVRWCYIAYGATGISIWKHGASASLLLPSQDESAEIPRSGFEITNDDLRTEVLIGRLIITTCAAMTIHGMSEPIGLGHARHAAARKREEEPPPVLSMFKLGKPITVDFRDRVREFATGKREGHKLDARHMVCGHFKRQHFGPKNAMVKTMWREPYWRGPAEAAVLVRTHVLKGEP